MSDTQPTTRYALIITEDGALVTYSVHNTRHERRDACLEALQDACDYVQTSMGKNILLTFGGADPDAAARSMAELYVEHGIDVYLEDHPVPAPDEAALGVPLLHSVFYTYGADENKDSISHFLTEEERVEYLRDRLINIGGDLIALDYDASTEALAAALEKRLDGLIFGGISVHLVSSLQPAWNTTLAQVHSL